MLTVNTASSDRRRCGTYDDQSCERDAPPLTNNIELNRLVQPKRCVQQDSFIVEIPSRCQSNLLPLCASLTAAIPLVASTHLNVCRWLYLNILNKAAINSALTTKF